MHWPLALANPPWVEVESVTAGGRKWCSLLRIGLAESAAPSFMQDSPPHPARRCPLVEFTTRALGLES